MSKTIGRLLSEKTTVQKKNVPPKGKLAINTKKRKTGCILPCIRNILVKDSFPDYETATGAMYIVASSVLQNGYDKEEAWTFISELNDYSGNMVEDEMLEKIVNRGEKLKVGCSFISGMNFCVPKKCKLFKGNRDKV